LNTK